MAKLLAGDEYGFIETADGREIYFHRNAVLDGAYRRLRVGSEVRFVEEEGAKGAQASTVRLIGKHHLVQTGRGVRSLERNCDFRRGGLTRRTAATDVNR